MKSFVTAFVRQLDADLRERRNARQSADDRSPALRQEPSAFAPDRAGQYRPRWFGFTPM